MGLHSKVRHINKPFTFPGFEDDEFYSILLKEVETKRKSGKES